MIAGRRAMRPACRSRRFRGWGCRGRGSAPSSAPRRRRSQGNFAKRQALSAIVNDDVSWLVLPHPHSALSRRPVTILPRELQQAVFVTHHPVFTEHSFFLQPEHVVQLSRRGTLPMIVGFSGRRSRVVAIVLGDVMLLQISIGIVIVADCGQPQLLDQPVLMGTVHALHPPLGLRRTGGDDADPQLGAHLSELGDRGFSPPPLLHVGQAHLHVLAVRLLPPSVPPPASARSPHNACLPERAPLGETPRGELGWRLARSCHAAALSHPHRDSAPTPAWLADSSAPATPPPLAAASCPPLPAP